MLAQLDTTNHQNYHSNRLIYSGNSRGRIAIYFCSISCYLGKKMPIFMCSKCGRKIKADYDICCTHSSICKGEKPPECCGQPMLEAIDD